MMIEVCSEKERELVDRMFHRALNCWQPVAPDPLLKAHEQVKMPLCTPECTQPCKSHRPAHGTYVMASGFVNKEGYISSHPLGSNQVHGKFKPPYVSKPLPDRVE